MNLRVSRADVGGRGRKKQSWKLWDALHMYEILKKISFNFCK